MRGREAINIRLTHDDIAEGFKERLEAEANKIGITLTHFIREVLKSHLQAVDTAVPGEPVEPSDILNLSLARREGYRLRVVRDDDGKGGAGGSSR